MSRRGRNMATARLQQDYLRILRDPVPYVKAHPLPSNILEWHFAVFGPADTPYQGGIYHGKLVFPSEFPFKPPSIYMITPNGRFKCNTRLCLSISDFHPDTWNPAWSVSTILTGLLSFMVERNATLGSIETTDYEKRQFAAKSLTFNLKDPIFRDLFPDLVEESQRKLGEIEKNAGTKANRIEHSKESDTNTSRSACRLPEGGWGGGSAFTNLAIFLGFAAFAYTVKCVVMPSIQ